MSNSGRFKIPPRVTTPAAPETPAAATPATHERIDPISKITATQQFVDGAAMVLSQGGQHPVKPKRLNVDLDPLDHKRLKVAAAAANVSMADLIRQWVHEKLG